MGKVLPLEALQNQRLSLRNQKKTVVFTNGCFDILHRGHVDYLEKSKALGDILIVGINSDASMRRIKGSKRPIVNQADRSYIIANLCPVDFVTIFEEDTPFELIKGLVPDLLVKGADWKIENIVGRDIVEGAGGKVATITFTPDHSTSSIIDTIRERFA